MTAALDTVKAGQAKAMANFGEHLDVCAKCQGGPFRMCKVGQQLCEEWSTMDAVVAITERHERDERMDRGCPPGFFCHHEPKCPGAAT